MLKIRGKTAWKVGSEELGSEVGVELNGGEKRSVSEKRECEKKVDQVWWSREEGDDG